MILYFTLSHCFRPGTQNDRGRLQSRAISGQTISCPQHALTWTEPHLVFGGKTYTDWCLYIGWASLGIMKGTYRLL